MAEEQIGTQMVPPREGALCCGLAQEHLVTRLPPASHLGQGSMVRIRRKKLLASCLCVSATVFLLVTLQVVVELGKFEGKNFKNSNLKDGYAEMEKEPVPLHPFLKREGLSLNKKNTLAADSYPIMLWWSPLTGETGRLGQCGLDACFFTINRTYLHHQRTKVLLFYGTDFNIDSLPLPRKAHHDWALFHEESPKNNYKLFHQPVITLFNYTATFSRHSHLPLTTQYLEGPEVLTSLQYLVPLQSKNNLRKSLAPLVYVQSDCDPPSDRDSYVRELMTYIEVDSYGECLRNRDLPQPLNSPASMDAEGFYRILAQYKFILAFENAVCDDYITEKFWRPLKLGVVPVYYGSPSIADWLPSNRSAILVSAFSHPRELASYIRQLDHDDRLYAAYLEWKLKGEISNHRLLTALRERKWGVQDITQENYIEAFECMVCTKVWDNIRLQEKGLPPKTWKADVSHLSCPEPTAFAFSPLTRPRSSLREMWIPSFQQSKKEARALRWLVDRNQNFSTQEFWALVFKD
ncbi:alpha-(1,3)-fucosyltransferase 10 [Phacochoerus africanus]|uniref:alpha-(1,3)-fucosyltransferase 10 n=1 Tax=Phacochoerus africanus TaxID=41426 RepID=UPI001FDAC0CB|nr:alpha-(1,3)-fucosyltransferase 10 [Phacochoerus africanus]